MKIYGNLVDIHLRDIYKCCITVDNGKIIEISRCNNNVDLYIIPGLVDAHIHIESSMVTPSAFAVEAVKHGTVAVVSDPHEIANICGIEGVDFMINDSKSVPLKFFFGAPSCVPATSFETSGGIIDKDQVENLLKREEIHYLSEMMNYPGVIFNNIDVIGKINAAKRLGKPIDGHAPGLRGNDLKKYVVAGITTDHECSSLEEAEEKISLGMKILIREGSAAKNMDNLKTLIKNNQDNVMLCSDDLHPEMLMKGHINRLIARLIKEGYDIFDVLRCATINPVVHYNLTVGLLREGDAADFVLVESLENMNVLETWIGGSKVYGQNQIYFSPARRLSINRFNSGLIKVEDIIIKNKGANFRVIEAFDGELLTKERIVSTGNSEDLEPDLESDYLKIVVKDRYNDGPPQTGFIKGFGLKRGAFASSVAHDSHNIICIGTNDYDIVNAINAIVAMKGGLSVSCEGDVKNLQLSIGGIMSSGSCADTAFHYDELNKQVIGFGCTMSAPFMTLAFMALLVIPELKIGDKGLFDVRNFRPVSLFCN
ncbi:MAG: adenine deaminase [Bacteroidetes bacterium]|nr:adenine deaminase [Bacteroidota bacterium]